MAENATKFIPIPEKMQRHFKKPECNFSLYFPRMVAWKWTGGKLDIFTVKEEKKDKDNGKEENETDAMAMLLKQSSESYKFVQEFLLKKQELLDSYVESAKKSGFGCVKITAKTNAPFITGLGSGHPTEKGMILDRNTGVPYIPASSVKGVMRFAHAINIADGRNEVPDYELEKYFGTTDEQKKEQKDKTRGQLIFLDAYPTVKPTLKMDIMNPHYRSYYEGQGKEQPVETESPVPIKFLTVETGIKFSFYCLFRHLETDNAEEIENDIKKMFETAFETLGFGGKTSIGYGRFKK